MEKIKFVNNSEPYLSAENLNQLQDNMENAINTASNVTVLWTGDVVPTAIDTNFTATFSSSNLRPYNYSLCYAIFNIDNKRVAVPFRSLGYDVSVTFTGHWALSSGVFVYLTANFGGTSAFNFQIKELGNMTLDKIHLVEIIGIK